MSDQELTIARVGTSYRVHVDPLGAEFMFRDVSIAGELRADIDVRHVGAHLFRTTTTLSLTGRDRVARVAAELDSGDGEAWRRATFAATEAVLEQEESLGGAIDLRFAEAAGDDAGMVVEGFFPASNSGLIAPNEIGKTTIIRAIMLSVTTGLEIIPGLVPAVTGPVLDVVGEDPFAEFHARSLDEICRGIRYDRASAPHPIHMIRSRCRPLYRLSRSLAEQAADCAAAFFDSHQSLLGPMGDAGNIRDRDQRYWDAIDEIGIPSFTVGHPNRGDRQHWNSSDGSFAGSDVNQDRIRCRWLARFRDDDRPEMGEYVRRYTLDNPKWTHGPRFASISFAIRRFRAYGETGWTVKFEESGELPRDDGQHGSVGRPTVFAETLAAWRAGARDGKSLAEALNISQATARQRLHRFADDLSKGHNDA
jgi:hypothetical protein